MDASKLTLARTLVPILPIIVLLVAPHLVSLDASTRLENRLVRVTTRDADGHATTEAKRSDVRVVDLYWQLGPHQLSPSTTTASILAITTKCRTLGEAIGVLLSRMQAGIGVCLLPLAFIASIMTCRASKWHSRPTVETCRYIPPWQAVAACMAVLCALIVVFLLNKSLWPAGVSELARWYGLSVSSACPFIYITIVAPIAEEIVFRAGVCRISVERLGPRVGIVVQALVFAAFHLATPLHTATGFVGGMILGIVYIYSRSLTAAILLHIGANSVLAIGCLWIA